MCNKTHSIKILPCDICDKLDTIMISDHELSMICDATGIGIYTVDHDDHYRKVYLNRDTTYIGDIVYQKENLVTQN